MAGRAEAARSALGSCQQPGLGRETGTAPGRYSARFVPRGGPGVETARDRESQVADKKSAPGIDPAIARVQRAKRKTASFKPSAGRERRNGGDHGRAYERKLARI